MFVICFPTCNWRAGASQPSRPTGTDFRCRSCRMFYVFLNNRLPRHFSRGGAFLQNARFGQDAHSQLSRSLAHAASPHSGFRPTLCTRARLRRPCRLYITRAVNAFMQAINAFMQAVNAFMQAVNAFMQAVNAFMHAPVLFDLFVVWAKTALCI